MIAVYVWAPVLWSKASLLYLAVVSNYALVAALASCEQAAEAKERASTEVQP